MRFTIPNTVFVPYAWGGERQRWVKRDDLPRFLEPEQAAQYLLDHPTISMQNGCPVFLQWREEHDWVYILEYLRGTGRLP